MDFLNPANRTLNLLPAALRALLDAELAAGNEIVDADHGSPAPPAGLCVKLARPVTTCPRESTPEIHFYDRNSSLYSGEFHDDKRFFFIIEPPHPQPPETDSSSAPARPAVAAPTPTLAPAPKAHRPTAKMVKADVRDLVLKKVPDLIAAKARAQSLVRALETANLYAGLSPALDEVERFHPPEVVDALLRGALLRNGETAVHLAAMLVFLHGQAEEAFDMTQRPFFLRFNTTDRTERVSVFSELCARIGVDAQRYLSLPER